MNSPEPSLPPDEAKVKLSETLMPGQNFYDQVPFRRIIDELTPQTSIDPAKLRTLITDCARLADPTYSSGKVKGQELTVEQLTEKANKGTYDRDIRRIFMQNGLLIHDQSYLTAFKEVFVRLTRYTNWHNYVNEQIREGYAKDGSPLADSKMSLPDSYAKYCQIKAKGSKGILKGIEDVFEGDPLNQVAQGKGSVNRQWTQRAAAETTKPK